MSTVGKLFAKKFNVNCGVLEFILYSFVSAGVYPYYWLLNFIKSADDELNRIFVSYKLVFVSFALNVWALIMYDESDEILLTMSGLMWLIHYVLDIYVCIKLKSVIEKLFSKYGVRKSVSMPLSVVLPIFNIPIVYQFYLISKVAKGDIEINGAENN